METFRFELSTEFKTKESNSLRSGFLTKPLHFLNLPGSKDTLYFQNIVMVLLNSCIKSIFLALI
ncbi:hypothetical protein LEP1GSC034_1326 [Leptospira interrogans str. 2003000735]|uniref:Uncharacterized protein n=1 Tax=Leptospira interrogans str. 2002000626 TaxID=996803 RepID=A0A829DAP3_LEPIR|nr:hypothetical protein [Leptospira interrogans]EMN51073.1 hypothetical protein LEP1GSC088_4209 [Leptospira interrogans str. L1207]EMY05879.1 hypothetical protein LEP1GSC029_2599 [Leptospira interrogans str. 2002000626]EKN87633.1 hypothetical protein LEP1GSC027_3625 [Leptospira interrogans str. 2002000624]EKQ48968.1 hypothetical protein LEP1GSC026_0838 [Leptospira interrogans str. 2002000623]EMJ67164.1 hypothetical protein LEP1GSC034_1326 [Leptospira interrogans str. 2003000735]